MLDSAGLRHFFLFTLPALVHSFAFSASTPTQCDNIDITWSGGSPPYQLLLIHPGGTNKNISIPASAYSGTQGSFTTQVNFAQNERLMIAMSDSTGITAGGISDVLFVGQSRSGQNCNTTDPDPDFTFSLDKDLKQCEPYPFSEFPGAIQPVTVTGFIALDHAFVLHPPIGNTFNWIANLTAGTSVLFSMVDSQGRIGGNSDMKVVQSTDNTSCLLATPSSSVSLSTSSQTQSGSPTNTTDGPSSNTTDTRTPTNIAGKASSGSSAPSLIIGLAVGGSAFVLILAIGVFFCTRRKREAWRYRISQQKHNMDLIYDPVGASTPGRVAYLLAGRHAYDSLVPPTHTSSAPSTMTSNRTSITGVSSATSAALNIPGHPQLSHLTTPHDSTHINPFLLQSDTGTRSSSHSKLSRMTEGQSQPTTPPIQHSSHVIVHTDVEESMQPPIELPPQYSEHHTPLQGLPTAVSDTTQSPSSKRKRNR